MSKFTPGPWIVNTDNGQLGDVSTEDRKYAIALAQEISVDDKIRHKSETRIANAYLISAAPDMHKVCDGLEKWWRLPNAERTIEAIEPVIRDALEALAKADSK